MASNQQKLVTTDYVLDELLTLLIARGERGRLHMVQDAFLSANWADIIFISPEDFRAGWDVLMEFSDKQWSFTDCVSRVVMKRLNIQQAFSFDLHFQQFGIVTVVP